MACSVSLENGLELNERPLDCPICCDETLRLCSLDPGNHEDHRNERERISENEKLDQFSHGK